MRRTLALLTLELDGDKWSSLHPSCLTPEESAPSTHGIGEKLGGPQRHSGCFEVEKKSFTPACNGTMFASLSNPQPSHRTYCYILVIVVYDIS